jgi:carboxypeptidase family protein
MMHTMAAGLLGTLALCACSPLLSAQTGNRLIAGVVSSTSSGQPLEGADVMLRDTRDSKIVAETITDPEGRFSFPNLLDGKFILSASRRGYSSAAYEEHDGALTAIVTGENQTTTGLTLSLPRLGAIFGTVTEDSGDPAPNAHLSLYRHAHREGVTTMQRAGVTDADPAGNFEFPHLAPGAYYLCASGMPWYRPGLGSMQAWGGNGATESSPSPMDMAYPLTCFPDVQDPAGAEAISLPAGDHIQTNIVFHPVPAVHIRFQIPKSGMGRGISMPQFHQDVFGISDFVQTSQFFIEQRDNDGSMTVDLSGIAPGHYDFDLGGQNRGADTARFGNIDASSGELSIDTSSLHPVASVSGKLIAADGSGLPNGSSVSLLSGHGETAAAAEVATDGTFRIRQAPPGSYEVVAAANGRYLAVAQLSRNGVNIDGSTLKIGADPVELAVHVVRPVASIGGFVTRNGQPASGVFVLLAPDNLRAGRSAWQPNQSDSDGSFELENIMPGQYTVVAIERGWTLDWGRPEVLRHYLARGIKVTVDSGSKKIELQSRVEAQDIAEQHTP